MNLSLNARLGIDFMIRMLTIVGVVLMLTALPTCYLGQEKEYRKYNVSSAQQFGSKCGLNEQTGEYKCDVGKEWIVVGLFMTLCSLTSLFVAVVLWANQPPNAKTRSEHLDGNGDF